jgi:lipopolysaccharide biosynthesis glycosyltransferase
MIPNNPARGASSDMGAPCHEQKRGAALHPEPRENREDETPLEILFCANPGYYRHAAVAAVSLAENNPRSRTNIHVLTSAEDGVAEAMFRASLAGYRHIAVTFHHVSDSRLDEVFFDRHLTREAYLRFLAPAVFPASIGRVLYLDCDLVVLDDLGPLWATDLRGKAIAAAPDFPWGESGTVAKRMASLGLGAGDVYVNSGVLLLDLDRWRRDNLSDRLFAYARARGSALAFHDQDAINAVLRDDIHVIDCRWNLQSRMYRLGRRSFPREFTATRQARRRPAILHYTTGDKPWLFRSQAARKRHYFRYLGKTAWRNAMPVALTVPRRVEWRLGRRLLRVGIDYMQIISSTRYAISKSCRPVRRGIGRFRQKFSALLRPKLRENKQPESKPSS